MSRRSKMYLLVGLAILLAIVSWFLLFAKKANMAMEMPPVVVEAVQAISKPWQQRISATGTLVANQGIIIKSEIEGRVTNIYFTPGASIEARAPLIQLNSDILKAKLAAATAQYQLSESNYTRGLEIFKKRVIAKAELDKLLATRNSDKARMEMEQATLNQSLIRAPFSGRIGLNLVNEGDYVRAGQELVNLQALDPMRVDFSIPEVSIGKIAVGQSAIIYSRAYPNQPFTGRVSAIDTMENPNTRSVAARASVPNKEQRLLPGGFVEVELLVGSHANVIMLPQTAIVEAETGHYVYKVVEKKAVKTPVKLGDRTKSDVVIVQGVNPGDVIVTAGQMKLQDGASVLIQPTPAPSKSG